MADWTWVPPAQTGYQEEGTGLLPLGRYRMPDGSQQVSFGLPQGLLDAYRNMRQGLGFEQDPQAPQGYVSQNAMIKAAFGGAGGAMTGALGMNAARAAGQNAMLRRATVSSGGAQPDVPKPITAYHGSPHDFDKFDLTKIGTGEGAQAFGHGLYFAENPGVAGSYRTSLSEAPKWLKELQFDMARLREMEAEAPRDWRGRLKETDEIVRLRAKIERLQAKADDPSLQGRLYKVEINARPEQFLDWDKPLSQQPKAAQEAIEKVLSALPSDRPVDRTRITGADLIDMTGSKRGAEALREYGIPGIRYLDQGSRTDGKGTYNYVIFDDSLVKIAEKYGLAIPGPSLSGQEQSTAVRGKDMKTLLAIARSMDQASQE